MPQWRKSKRGFTLIELLVVIAIIGVLSTLAVVALSAARRRARDVKRVSDVRQITTALELGYTDIGAYPAGASVTLGGASTAVLCNVGGASKFQADVTGCATVYMGRVPANPSPNGADYVYASATGSAAYSISFSLETATGQLGAGANCANQTGIQAGSSC